MVAPPQHTRLTPVAAPSNMDATKTTKPINSTVNPIIPGFAPDPSIIHHGGKFWLVNSTFQFFPGLPVYHSTDLTHWTHHSNALSRQSQLSLLRSGADLISARNPDAPNTKLCFQGGLYAPTLRWHEKSEVFYLLCTNIVRLEERDPVTGRMEAARNFWLTCTDIEKGEWSDPVEFEFSGIDPSIWFEEEEGRTRGFVVGSRGPGPGTKINLFEVDLKTGRKVSEERTLWEGELKFYPEGPHVYKKGGWYWLVIAEGGTHEGHCINVARSRNLEGPYESNPGNPVLKKCEYGDDVQCTGHMDLVEDEEGRWWGVCLGMRRRGEKGVRMTHGRETFLTRVTWPEEGSDGWLGIEKAELSVEGKERKGTYKPGVGKEGVDLLWIREPRMGDYVVEKGGEKVKLKSSKDDFDQWENPVSFVGKRQRLMEGKSEARLMTKGVGKGVIAGLAVYKDEHRFVRVYLDGSTKKVRWELLNKAKDLADSKEAEGQVDGEELWLQIGYDEEKYTFAFTTSKDIEWTTLVEMDHAKMSCPDFVGPVIGVFATCEEGQEVQFEDMVVDIE